MTEDTVRPRTTSATPNPNDVLAMRIADALVDAGLIRANHKEELLGKLKTGGVKQEDWNLWIDMATTPQSETAGEANNE